MESLAQEAFYSTEIGFHVYSGIGLSIHLYSGLLHRHIFPLISVALTSQYIFFFTLKSFISYYFVSLIPGTVNKYYLLQSSAFTPVSWDAFI